MCGIYAIFFHCCFMNETQVLMAVSRFFCSFFSRSNFLEGGFTFYCQGPSFLSGGGGEGGTPWEALALVEGSLVIVNVYLCGKFFPVQCCTQIKSMLAMFGQFFVYVFSHQATYLRYKWHHILDTLAIYYMYCTTTFPAHLTI